MRSLTLTPGRPAGPCGAEKEQRLRPCREGLPSAGASSPGQSQEGWSVLGTPRTPQAAHGLAAGAGTPGAHHQVGRHATGLEGKCI